jgi:large subunit ribosomal protein L7/L12
LKDLLDAFEEKFGVTAAAPVGVAAAGGAAEDAPAAADIDEFTDLSYIDHEKSF